jgi:4-aminobutyrate aminotransferase
LAHGRPAGAAASTDPVVDGRGLYLRTAGGRTLLDGCSGTFNLPLGYSYPSIVSATRGQLSRVVHVSSELLTAQAAELAELLVAATPPYLDRVWLRDLTGSTAVEGAIKAAQIATGRSEIVSLFYSHHGQTIFSTAISGNAFRRRRIAATHTVASLKIPAPYCLRCFYEQSYPSCQLLCARRLSEFLEFASSGSIAALIVEPILGNGGNIVPPPGYLAELQSLCRERGILVIADEIQTGVGRTGEFLASTNMGLEPDIVVLGKGLGGIGLPISAIMMRSSLNEMLQWEHSFTSGGNLLALAAAIETVKTITASGFLESVRERGRRLGEGLVAALCGLSAIREIRGVGMMWGVELLDGEEGRRLANRVREVALRDFDLVVRTSRYGFGNVVKVRPALIATEGEIDEIVRRLSAAIVRAGEQDEGRVVND